jgi:hypothetical protein
LKFWKPTIISTDDEKHLKKKLNKFLVLAQSFPANFILCLCSMSRSQVSIGRNLARRTIKIAQKKRKQKKGFRLGRNFVRILTMNNNRNHKERKNLVPDNSMLDFWKSVVPHWPADKN